MIPSYNRATELGDAIGSALNQTFESLEVIVVDDGSDDNTSSVVAAISDARLRYDRIDHAGPSVARNRGIELSKGEFIAFLDSDDIWYATKLERQLPLFENSEIGWTYTDLDYLGEVLIMEEGRGYQPESRDTDGLPREVRELAFAWSRRDGGHPYGELRSRVVDAATGEFIPARIYVRSSTGKWHFVKSAAKDGSAVEYRKNRGPKSVEMHTTISAHPFRSAPSLPRAHGETCAFRPILGENGAQGRLGRAVRLPGPMSATMTIRSGTTLSKPDVGASPDVFVSPMGR